MAISSAIVPYKGNQSSVIVKPQQSMAIVPVKKESTNKAEVTSRDLRKLTLMLLRKRQQRDRLEAKFAKVKKKSAEKDAARKEEAKQEKSSFLTKVGSGMKRNAEKLGGDLFGAIGDLLGFIALDWLSKPENQETVKMIVEGVKHIFAFVDWWVTGSVDNLLSGFTQMVAGDSLLERVFGFFRFAAGILGLKYFLRPWTIFTDAQKLIQGKYLKKLNIFFKKWQKQGLGRALKFAFPKMASILGKIKTALKPVINIGKKVGGFLMGRITNALQAFLRKSAGDTVIKGIVKKLVKPAMKIVNKIPVIGPLIGMGINVALGDSWQEAGIKAVGTSLGTWLGAGLGTLIFPGVGTFIGGFLGGLIGDWLGGRIYEMMTGKKASAPTPEEKENAEIMMEMKKLKEQGKTNEQIFKIIAKQRGTTAEKIQQKVETSKAKQFPGATDTTPLEIGKGKLNLTPAQYKDLAFIVSGEAARGTADEYGVAAAVLNRVADPVWPNTIAAVGSQSGQFEAVYSGKAYNDPELAKKLASEAGQAQIVSALQKLAGRTDFKGQSQLKNRGPGDPMFHERGNFYHYTSQKGKNDPAPNNPPQHWKKLLKKGEGGEAPANIILPPQQRQERSQRMNKVSMEVTQLRKHYHKTSSPIIVYRTGGGTAVSHTTLTTAPRLNNNKVSHKRGL